MRLRSSVFFFGFWMFCRMVDGAWRMTGERVLRGCTNQCEGIRRKRKKISSITMRDFHKSWRRHSGENLESLLNNVYYQKKYQWNFLLTIHCLLWQSFSLFCHSFVLTVVRCDLREFPLFSCCFDQLGLEQMEWEVSGKKTIDSENSKKR